MNQRQKKFLFELLSQPSAPFREQSVLNSVLSVLQRRQIPCFADPVGNLVVGVSSKTDYLKLIQIKSREPVRMFVAHMDHPGFHGYRWLHPRRLKVKWHGGSPTRFLSGAKVWLASEEGYVSEGILRKPVLNKTRRYLVSAEVQLSNKKTHMDFSKASNLYGGLQFRKPVWQQGKKI